ncbi:hypothetical protein GHT06_017588 [Daphnia sinensis]|uniref:Membrane insertase YidC/Oxa/ALB C-terminal domain-containing protein n=1 Tax=Daphnia sinensis TaxID=1820382 RepID=A0AAD5PRJ2_9CRUS|nr:hypothetical protein GHT06_017588 [Daphnia sinensis]
MGASLLKSAVFLPLHGIRKKVEEDLRRATGWVRKVDRHFEIHIPVAILFGQVQIFPSVFFSQCRQSRLHVQVFNVKPCSQRQLSLSACTPEMWISPSGLIQTCLEWLHVELNIPWWACIALGVLTVCFLMSPLVFKAQRNESEMTNMPELLVLQQKMTDARQSGNADQCTQVAYEIQQFMKEKGLSLFKNLTVPLIQAPAFISFFFALKAMSNFSVESMNDGGLFWFTDLTFYDPCYMLSMLTSITVWATIELGTGSAWLSAQGSLLLIYFFRAIPFIAILCYWLTTNITSLVQVNFHQLPNPKLCFGLLRKIRRCRDGDEIQQFMKGKGLNPFENWTIPLIQVYRYIFYIQHVLVYVYCYSFFIS